MVLIVNVNGIVLTLTNITIVGYGSKLLILQMDGFQLNITIPVGHLAPNGLSHSQMLTLTGTLTNIWY